MAELSQWGVDTASFPELAVSDSECANLAGIPDAFADFQFNRQKLNLSIPHAAMNTRSTDEVPIERWDEGIPALLLNYNMNSYQSRYKGAETYESTYLNLRPGLNIGPGVCATTPPLSIVIRVEVNGTTSIAIFSGILSLCEAN